MSKYWPEAGKANTEATCALALQRAQELKIRDIVVASNTGETARFLVGKVENLVVVTHHVGFREPGQDEMSQEERDFLSSRGVRLVTATHLFGGIDRAVANKFGGLYPGGMVAQTLRLFGQGTKVCLEIATMAMDAGALPWGRDVIAVGGSGRGADTALVLRPTHAKNFFETKVLELICKPRDWEVR
ncbi:MAG: pyruvate kinase alpha/beta domain-containing protein [Bacillota bacterium]|jgi:hypothetical protein